jgi:hypothetical protein
VLLDKASKLIRVRDLGMNTFEHINNCDPFCKLNIEELNIRLNSYVQSKTLD